ncbi:hypothetical protein HG444_001745 [Candidatus Saccharibacteria bacterium]|nr:hypothetical protein [Candidatus Saccharibacteria bacterium]
MSLASIIHPSQLTTQDKVWLGAIALGSAALYLMRYNRAAEITYNNAPEPVPYGEEEQTPTLSSSVCWLNGKVVPEHKYAACRRNAKAMNRL